MGDDSEASFEDAKFSAQVAIGWVVHADAKAAFYLTVALAAMGLSLTEIPALVKVCSHFWSDCTWGVGVLIGVHVIFYGAAIVASCMAMSVIKPRVVPESATHSWFFFQSIAGFQDVAKWRDFSNGLNQTERRKQLVDQIWNISRVATEKYRKAAWADLWLRIAIGTGVVAVIVTLIARELI